MREGASIRSRIRNRQLVRDQAPMRGRELIGYLALAALIALPAVLGLWQQSDFVRLRFEIETLRREKLALQERYRRLRIERGTLESLDRIAHEARKAGLVPRHESAASPPPIIVSPGAGSRGELARAERVRRGELSTLVAGAEPDRAPAPPL